MKRLFRNPTDDERPLFSRRTKIIFFTLLVLCVLWWSRALLVRFSPIHHEGTVMRINTFWKGGADTRQTNQFSILFEDGFNCEGYDTSFVNVREGDLIKIKGYHDVRGWPVSNPGWWECDEGQLIEITPYQKLRGD